MIWHLDSEAVAETLEVDEPVRGPTEPGGPLVIKRHPDMPLGDSKAAAVRSELRRRRAPL